MRLQACVRCARPSPGPYCDEHRPRNFNPAKPFGGGQGSTRAKRARRWLILERDEFVCRWCGAPATQVDHVTAQSRGGSDHPDNLVASCRSCNLRRGADSN